MQTSVIPHSIELIATIILIVAILHTFLAGYFLKLSSRFEHGSILHNLFHLLGEVEVVFGIWSGIFLLVYTYIDGFAVYEHDSHSLIGGSISYLNSRNFTEPIFVFVIMCIAATRPIVYLAEESISLLASLLPLGRKQAFYFSTLVFGPILGSFITEPAAITVCSLIILNKFFNGGATTQFKYATLGLLFVNISIGGTLTHFAAPPVLMVAQKFGWGARFMFFNFGLHSVLAIFISTSIYLYWFRKDLRGKVFEHSSAKDRVDPPPVWVITVQCLFLFLAVFGAHYSTFLVGIFLFFLGWTQVTEKHQNKLKVKESLLVSFFLAGLVVLGGLQSWWLKDVLSQLGDLSIFFGATALTAVTDNAAITYLGTLVDLSDSQKYNLVAGAVTGGGLTIIANAPNPAGYGILKEGLGEGGLNHLLLFKYAIVPTFIAAVCFQIF